MSPQAVNFEVVTHVAESMGGTLEIAITAAPERRVAAAQAACRAATRVNAWASRLTRFSPDSDLVALNSSEQSEVVVRPTLAAALRWAQDAQRRSNGVVNATMLAQRLAAESGAQPAHVAEAGAWTIVPKRRSAVVKRTCEFSFDLDGVAKGWIADRAADLLRGWPGVAVNADGDIAFQIGRGVEWLVAITDPGDHGEPIATLKLSGGSGWSRSLGVATSGTTIHRWQLADGRVSHHLIDRRTGRPAQTDVVQATVVAPSAREAEMFAKSAVILGAVDAFRFLAESAALAAILVLDDGDVVAMPGTEKWLA